MTSLGKEASTIWVVPLFSDCTINVPMKHTVLSSGVFMSSDYLLLEGRVCAYLAIFLHLSHVSVYISFFCWYQWIF